MFYPAALTKTLPTKGMTLLEVVIAFSVISVALTGMFSAVSSMMVEAESNKDQMTALNIARQELAVIQNASFQSVFTQYGPAASSANSFPVKFGQNGATEFSGTCTFVFPTNVSGNLDETLVNDQLGMPQDLNGNGVATDTNVSGSYTLLPVGVRINWSSANGQARVLQLNTILVKLK